MENHTHSHNDNSVQVPTRQDRYNAARQSTWASIAVNILLTIMQVVAGFFGHSQSLMADGMHSLSDFVSDVMVLFANRHGNRHADAEHPYGHARMETAATLILGAALSAMGVILLIAAGLRLQNAQAQAVHPFTLWIALAALAAKEGMFRYMLAVAKRVRSQMLVANAWHARSDAASSLVVVAGIVGNLLGYIFLDLVAAGVVGVMITYMGGKLAWGALSELIDTGLSREEVEAIRATLLATPGVLSLHELRTRKMADNALVDAHVLVDPKISVSEGHFIAESARQAVLRNHHVLDVMVHIDPEDDMYVKPNAHLPARDVLLEHLAGRLGGSLPWGERIALHYLDGKIDADLFLDSSNYDANTIAALRRRCADITADDPYFRSISLYLSPAQQ
jgi:cation diffusion facilitator family transporter